jgi:ATP-binding cassette subfamily C (CFTR/MRP) protein 4
MQKLQSSQSFGKKIRFKISFLWNCRLDKRTDVFVSTRVFINTYKLNFDCRVVLFFSLRKVVIYFQKEQKSVSDLDAFLSAFTLVLSRFIFSIVNSTTSLELTHHSMQIEACCMCLIYKKVLRLSQSSNVKVGQVLSLMSNELSKFQRQFFYFPTIVVAPLKLIFGTYLLYQDIEMSAVVGTLVLMAIFVFQGPSSSSTLTIVKIHFAVCMVKVSAKIWVKIVSKTGERIRLVDELISGIQFIKMSCWENIFDQLITRARRLFSSVICLDNSRISFQ